MKLENTRAVVTGGASGIGLAITKALRAEGVHVLIVGRNQARLNDVCSGDTAVTSFAADLSMPSERDRLVQHLLSQRHGVDIFINNAGIMQSIDLRMPDAMSLLEDELALNLSAPIHLATAMLPHLLTRPVAAIVNITTGLIYAPFGHAPGYSASKSGLHAFTQSLRWQTRLSEIQVLEVMPPAVDTPMTKDANISKVQPEVVAAAIVKALKNGTREIRVGQSKALYFMSRLAPEAIFKMMNKMAEKELTHS